VTYVEILQGSGDTEDPSPFGRVTTAGRQPIRDGAGVDSK